MLLLDVIRWKDVSYGGSHDFVGFDFEHRSIPCRGSLDGGMFPVLRIVLNSSRSAGSMGRACTLAAVDSTG
jgi:hypothetical protein